MAFQSTLPRRERQRLGKRKRMSHHFNPRSREGSDGGRGAAGGLVSDFNPRSREGSDREGRTCVHDQRNFNPRSREGSDPAWLYPPSISSNFNPRSREGSDDAITSGVYSKLTFQSTLPRRERLPPPTSLRFQNAISIHAPAKGATQLLCSDCLLTQISIHAPAKGATAFINIFSLAVRLFFISSHQ